MKRLFGDLFRECWRWILGCSGLFRGGFSEVSSWKLKETSRNKRWKLVITKKKNTWACAEITTPKSASKKCICSTNACIQGPGRFQWTVLCVHKAVSQGAVVHQMLVYKRLRDLSGPFCVFINLFLKTRLFAKCLYTSVWAILVDRALCS